MISMRVRLLSLAASTAMLVGATATPARASASLGFGQFTSGGSISYAGGVTPLVGTNIPIDFLVASGTVPNGFFAVGSGLLNFSTGNYDVPLTSASCTVSCNDIFSAGGSYTLTGTVAAAGASGTLLTGNFDQPIVFDLHNPTGVTGTGVDTFIHPNLLTFFNLPLSSIFSFRLTSNESGNTLAGHPLDPSQAGQAFNITAGLTTDANLEEVQPPRVPEPASLLLLGSGLSMIGAVIRRRRSANRS